MRAGKDSDVRIIPWIEGEGCHAKGCFMKESFLALVEMDSLYLGILTLLHDLCHWFYRIQLEN